MADKPNCYHCGLPVLTGNQYSALIFQEQRTMCCHGCQSVAESIIANGLGDYYRYRTEMPRSGADLVPEELKKLSLYDHPEVQRSFVHQQADHLLEASLIVEGITCAACVWLNERHLQQLPGVQSVAFNYASQRARISWDDSRIKLSQILAEIRRLGYQAHPFSARQQDDLRQRQKKIDVRRLAVAGLAAGQAMMIAVALYAGPAQGLEPATADMMRWFSLICSTPAVIYSAWPFYRAAWNGIVRWKPGMDVPIVLGLLTGYIGSLWATLQGSGTVYFDTITMLVFFLLATRYLERNAQLKSIEASENLLRLTPAVAERVCNGVQETVAVADLQEGDEIIVRPGEAVAADGTVLWGESSADESLLTGESKPLPKRKGSPVYAGSINYESPLTVRVDRVGENTMLAGISRLLDRARAEKPQLAQLADQVAAYFTSALLLLVVLIAWGWWQTAPDKALEVVLAVLVVSCPCALSLAAPAAFAAAGSHLVNRGVLFTRGHALEALARVTHVVFDKTGTLTMGRPVLLQTEVYGDVPGERCLQIAASLEKSSEHPLGRALLDAAGNLSLLEVQESINVPGQGITGSIAGQRYTVGNAQIQSGLGELPQPARKDEATVIWLSDGKRVLSAFVLSDTPRESARSLIQRLQNQHFKVSLFSGDSTHTVMSFGRSLGIADSRSEMAPQDKLAAIQALQAQGEVVAMVGDGINDAPVLAAAQVSIAMGSGTQMARASGDIILLTENLLEIDHALHTSRLGIKIIRQNFAWALAYNMVALPVAALGLLSPWMAALGMSVSSLIVVLNALRLRQPEQK